METVRQRDIGKHGDDRGQELKERPLDPLHRADKLIEEDNGGIQAGRSQSEQDTDPVRSALSSLDLSDQYETYGGTDKTQDLLLRQFFVKDDRRRDGHDDRRKIIAQGSNGYRSIFVGLKQKDPVEAHGHAREDQQSDILLGAAERDLRMSDKQIRSDQDRGKDSTVQCHFSRSDTDSSHKWRQRSEHQHGQDVFRFWGKDPFHSAPDNCSLSI